MIWIIIILLIAFVVGVSHYFQAEIDACFERDPSASNTIEVILNYSGLHAIMLHRLSNKLHELRIPFLPRFISQLARFMTGIEIHPGAQISKGCFIDHGMGIVVGETAVLGSNVTLYQGVTLGGTGKEKGKRHPTIGNNVVVGAGAKVLGNIKIGDNVVVGANAVVINDVPPNSTVVGVPGRIAKRQGRRFTGITLDHTGLPDPLSQSLEQLQEHMEHLEKELEKFRDA